MKHKMFLIRFLSLSLIACLAKTPMVFVQLSPFIRIEEADGTASGIVNKLVFPKGSLTSLAPGQWRINLSGTSSSGGPSAPKELSIDCDSQYKQAVLRLTPTVGNRLIIGPDWDGDFCHQYSDEGIYPSLFIHSPELPNEICGINYGHRKWLRLHHDGANAYMTTGWGDLILEFATQTTLVLKEAESLRLTDETGGRNMISIYSSERDRGDYYFGWQLAADYGLDQARLGLGTHVGRQLVICWASSEAKDYQHPPQDNPSVFIQSSTDPKDDPNQWFLLTHNKTDGIMDVGTGSIVHRANVVMEEKLNYARRSVKGLDNEIGVSPATLDVPTANSSHIMLTCFDPEGCICWLSEVDASIGDLLWLYIDPNGSECFFPTIADQQQTRLADRITITPGGVVSFMYEGDAWVQATQETK